MEGVQSVCAYGSSDVHVHVSVYSRSWGVGRAHGGDRTTRRESIIVSTLPRCACTCHEVHMMLATTWGGDPCASAPASSAVAKEVRAMFSCYTKDNTYHKRKAALPHRPPTDYRVHIG